jgi:hypothetical protein
MDCSRFPTASTGGSRDWLIAKSAKSAKSCQSYRRIRTEDHADPIVRRGSPASRATVKQPDQRSEFLGNGTRLDNRGTDSFGIRSGPPSSSRYVALDEPPQRDARRRRTEAGTERTPGLVADLDAGHAVPRDRVRFNPGDRCMRRPRSIRLMRSVPCPPSHLYATYTLHRTVKLCAERRAAPCSRIASARWNCSARLD